MAGPRFRGDYVWTRVLGRRVAGEVREGHWKGKDYPGAGEISGSFAARQTEAGAALIYFPKLSITALPFMSQP